MDAGVNERARSAGTNRANDLALLVEAARGAGEIALRFWGRSPRQWLKQRTSPVSEADIAVDRFLKSTLLAARPDYGWLSEETEDNPGRLACGRTFVVDPIDGTRGFLEGSDEWSVSLAIVEDGRPVAAALAVPARDEQFRAAEGVGAFGPGGRLDIGAPGSPAAALHIAGPRHWLRGRAELAGVRYVPSLALRLARVADGSFDAALVKATAHDWDLAAADLLVHEAGGSLFDASGRRPLYNRASTAHPPLAASRSGHVETMRALLREQATPQDPERSTRA